MKVSVTYQGKNMSVQFKGNSVSDLLQEMKVNPETVLVGRNNEIVAETEALKPGDRIEVIRTISGG